MAREDRCNKTGTNKEAIDSKTSIEISKKRCVFKFSELAFDRSLLNRWKLNELRLKTRLVYDNIFFKAGDRI